MLNSKNKTVNSGRVLNKLSTHKPPNNAPTTMTTVTQPIWDIIAASAKFLATPSGRLELTANPQNSKMQDANANRPCLVFLAPCLLLEACRSLGRQRIPRRGEHTQDQNAGHRHPQSKVERRRHLHRLLVAFTAIHKDILDNHQVIV